MFLLREDASCRFISLFLIYGHIYMLPQTWRENRDMMKDLFKNFQRIKIYIKSNSNLKKNFNRGK